MPFIALYFQFFYYKSIKLITEIKRGLVHDKSADSMTNTSATAAANFDGSEFATGLKTLQVILCFDKYFDL